MLAEAGEDDEPGAREREEPLAQGAVEEAQGHEHRAPRPGGGHPAPVAERQVEGPLPRPVVEQGEERDGHEDHRGLDPREGPEGAHDEEHRAERDGPLLEAEHPPGAHHAADRDRDGAEGQLRDTARPRPSESPSVDRDVLDAGVRAAAVEALEVAIDQRAKREQELAQEGRELRLELTRERGARGLEQREDQREVGRPAGAGPPVLRLRRER